ncbi:ATP-dependent DNA helicase PIF1-like, partial [Brachionus plicatilis]
MDNIQNDLINNNTVGNIENTDVDGVNLDNVPDDDVNQLNNQVVYYEIRTHEKKRYVNALELWFDFKEAMSEDYQNEQYGDTRFMKALGHIRYIFDRTLDEFNLPVPDARADDWRHRQMPQFQDDMTSQQHADAFENLGAKLNYEQRLLYHQLRERNMSIIPTAFTGIASAFLIGGGQTMHSKFKILIPTTSTSVSNINMHSAQDKQLRECSLFIVDKASMINSSVVAKQSALIINKNNCLDFIKSIKKIPQLVKQFQPKNYDNYGPRRFFKDTDDEDEPSEPIFELDEESLLSQGGQDQCLKMITCEEIGPKIMETYPKKS